MDKNQFETQGLEHLGILAGILKKTKFIETIDNQISVAKEKGAKVTMGERIAAMIFNALGFMDSRLYMFSSFLSKKPIKRLLNPELTAEDFTDDSLGRCLDKIAEYGPTKLVSDITFKIASRYQLLGKTVHVDTTSLTVYGDYDQSDEDPNTPKVTHGYSKDKRPDLKQLILNLAVNNKADLPVFMASHSGNASDQKTLLEATKQIEKCGNDLANTPPFIYVADSAIYESCLKEDHNILWLSRVPMTRKETKQFVENSEAYPFKPHPEEGYKTYSQEKTINGVQQRWLLVYSEQAHQRTRKTVGKGLAKEYTEVKKALYKLSKQSFNCQADAKKALERMAKKWKYHQIETSSCQSKEKYTKKGRPSKDATKSTVGYHIHAKIKENKTKISETLRQKSHFILATNQLDASALSDQEMLSEYKNQQKVERGFAFIKDNTFEVSSVFLKKPSRISALMAVMVLSLFVYSLAQYLLRQTLREKDDFVLNQLNKPIQNPTAKWIFFLFRNIQVLYIREANNQTAEFVVNLAPDLNRIITYFGQETMRIYGISLPTNE